VPHYRATIGADGSLTLPATMRKKLRIADGAEVEFFLTLDGDVFFHAITGKAKDWKGMFAKGLRSPPLSIEEMDAGIAEAVVEKYRRVQRQSARDKKSSRRPAAE
jgi:bifunctional DNA-binding transcriptional regulator/antitoxin component of YhaV-PrlF toxin-antitoxin module